MGEVVGCQGVEHFESRLQEKAEHLVDLLKAGDTAGAMDQISALYEFRHQVFYQEVGMLTRGLHEALKAFGSDVQVPGHEGELTDASQSLDYVVELTEKNAHETMDRLDRALAQLDAMDTSAAPELAADLKSVREELTEILVAQGYQDIAGQLIRKVMMLLSNVEQHLVQLMDMAAAVDRLGGTQRPETPAPATQTKENPIAAEGPQIRAKDSPDVVQEQDQVDELLSSLGF